MSDYSSFLSEYKHKVENAPKRNNASFLKPMNFVGISAKSPKMYIQLLQDQLNPVPFHDYHETKDPNVHRSFICKNFIKKHCPICAMDKDNTVGTKYVAKVITLQKQDVGNNKKKLVPEIIDITTTEEKAKEIAKKYSKLNLAQAPSDDGENVVISGLYRIGYIKVTKTVNNAIADIAEELDGIEGQSLVVSRKGEKKETRYAAQALPSNVKIDEDILAISEELSSTIDDYINMFISDSYYKKNFDIDDDELDTETSSSKEDESKSEKTDDSYDSDDGTFVDDDDDDSDLDTEDAHEKETASNESEKQSVQEKLNSLWED